MKQFVEVIIDFPIYTTHEDYNDFTRDVYIEAIIIILHWIVNIWWRLNALELKFVSNRNYLISRKL